MLNNMGVGKNGTQEPNGCEIKFIAHGVNNKTMPQEKMFGLGPE